MAEAAVQAEPALFDDIPVTDLASILIRVVVLPPKQKKGAAAPEPEPALPLDMEVGEDFLIG